MEIPVPESADILGFVAAHLAIGQPGLGHQRPSGLARRERAPLLQAMGAEKAPHRRIGRHWRQLGPRPGQRHQVVVMELDAPALVGGVLGQQGLAQRLAHRRLLAGILAPLAAQHADRVMAFAECPVVPSLDGGDAEADRRPGRRVAPVPCRQCFKRDAQGALLRRRRQQLADHRKA